MLVNGEGSLHLLLFTVNKPIFPCNLPYTNRTSLFSNNNKKRKCTVVVKSISSKSTAVPIPIMVNSCKGKMGISVIKAADAVGLQIIPESFGSERAAGNTEDICGHKIKMHGLSDRESVLASLYKEYPNMIVVDYTVPAAVNANADLYCKTGVPFVMGTTGGNRDRLYKTVRGANNYALISPQMGKQVVAFLAAMEIMGSAFSGYSLHVKESHQAAKLDTSGTAKAVISCFKKFGVSFDDQIEMIRDPKEQRKIVPKEYLNGHAFHTYSLSSPDKTVSFTFQHNVYGRAIYAEGTVDAVLFLAKKIQSKSDKRIYDMFDVFREGNMR